MKLIKSSVEILPQPPGIEGVYKQIEIAGRTCYKSEDKITEDSAKKFVDMLIDRGHTAMLEHGTVYLKVPLSGWGENPMLWEHYLPSESPWVSMFCDRDDVYVTTNYRYIKENLREWMINKYWCEPTKFHPKRISVRFICDRGISHELVRHRVFSFAQESTRYCNYSKDKFGNELTFIIPSWMDLPEGAYDMRDINGFGVWHCNAEYVKEQIKDGQGFFLNAIAHSQRNYLNFCNNCGWAAQQARAILPNALKTEVVMTGFADDWKHFFKLRCAKSAHPDMQVLANQLKDKLEKQGLI